MYPWKTIGLANDRPAGAFGWHGDSGVYVLLPAAIAHLRSGAKSEGLETLDEIAAHVKRDSWQAALVAFFRGQLSPDALIAKAKRDDGLLTEAHAYIDILAGIAGDRATADSHLAWVEANGRKDFIVRLRARRAQAARPDAFGAGSLTRGRTRGRPRRGIIPQLRTLHVRTPGHTSRVVGPWPSAFAPLAFYFSPVT